MFSAAQCIGVFLIIFAFCSFLLNTFLIYVFISKRLISTKHENHTIYRLILNFLVCDSLEVWPTIYIAVCAVLEKDLLQGDFPVIIGTINNLMYYEMMLMLMTMAINRYVGICHFNKYASIFTARTAAILIVVTWSISGVFSIYAGYFVYCCALVPFYPVFTFIYLNPLNLDNVMARYNHLNEVCCCVLFFCYARILWTVHKIGREALSRMDRSIQRHRTRQNIRFAFQFLFISLFFILIAIFYVVFPKLLPEGVLLPYSLISVCMIANCTINSIMYLSFNPEVRRLALLTLFGKKNTVGVRGETQNVQRSRITQEQRRNG
uniref:G-protein coupled receptors family 1 profile domain-containing protein n=1 Tax=Plectus sambesii TaxID=2011161 RepID=A0A914V7C7_9BILA